MKIKQKVGISGRVDIEKYNTRTGELVEKREGKNMLLNSYLNGYFEEGYPLLSSDVFSACMLGDSNTAVARTQTGVQGSTLASKASKAVDTSLIALMNRGWDTKNTFTGHGGDVYSVNFHPDPNSNLAISGSYDDTAKIFEYDTTAGTTTEMATFTGHNTRVYSANFHPDPNSNLAISGSFDDTVKIFEYDTTAGTTTEVATFTGHNSYVSSVNFHPDPNSNLAISGSWDNTVKIFEILTDKKNTISANGEWVFEAGEGTGTIREIFLQADFSGYPLYGSDTPVARKVISPEIVKDEYHEIILKWTIEITKPDLGWSGTLSDVGMSGENISYELTLGNQSLAQNTGFIKPLSWNINQNNTADVFLRTFEMNTEPTSIEATKLTGDYYETQIDRVSTYQILKTYTASQYKIEYRVTLDVDDSNTANIGGLRLENDGTESSLRVLFDPKLPKTDTYRLHFDFEYQLNPS